MRFYYRLNVDLFRQGRKGRVENLSYKTDRNTTSQMERRTERGEEREVVIMPVLAWGG
jgi:hypothetical protein